MELLPRLYRRIDVVPVGLVLAQAANESGWGTSRFSLEVNNLFGEWTYKARHGVLPQQRADGARHFVRSFGNLRASVRSYMHNINSGQAYAPLRELRARMRLKPRKNSPNASASWIRFCLQRGWCATRPGERPTWPRFGR